MAVKIKGEIANEQNEQAQAQGQQNVNMNTNTIPTTPPTFGINNRLAAFGSGGEVYEKLYEKILQKVKYLNEELKTEEKYNVIKLLKSTYGLNYSGIILTETLNGVTSAHILIVERTGDYPSPLVENIAGIRYEIVRTPADALDEKYVNQAITAVSTALKIPANKVVITDGTLVPNEFDVNDDALVNDLVINTLNATHSEVMIRANNYKGFNITSLLNTYRNGKFLINLYFNTDETDHRNQINIPIRQDICVSLSFKVNNNNQNRSINIGNDNIDIVKVYGYVDFEWVGPAVVNNMMTTQKFVPNFIITHIESPVALTPDIVMLGVASCLAVKEDLNWLQAFRPTPSKKNEIDFNDIGALNIEGNIENDPSGFGKKFDTKAKTVTIIELSKFVQMLVQPNMIISIDVPKAGPETWFTSVFQYIKLFNSKEAQTRVYDYIANLTNGNFNGENVPMFVDVTNKIHAGYFKTKDGAKDIRHLSTYLAVANYISATGQQPALISQYTNTLYKLSIPAELRASERKKFIDEMAQGQAVYKMMYDRLTFSALFLQNLVNALKMAGFAPVFNNMGVNNEMFARRFTADFASAMLSPDARIMGQNNMYGNFFMPYGYTRTF